MSFLFRDPLLSQSYLSLDRSGVPITIHNEIEINVEGDPFLYNYIKTLDGEVFATVPEMSTIAQVLWEQDNWSDVMIKITDAARMHGWCLVVKRDDGIKVLSVPMFSRWYTETDEKVVRVGATFVWSDDLGNSWSETYRFDDPDVYLVKWAEGDDMLVFAFPDLSNALLTLIYELRQIRGQYVFSASKPSFLHFVYGTDIDNTTATMLDSKIANVDVTTAIGIARNLLEEVRTIENKNMSLIEPSMERQLKMLAGYTRLPLSFWLGEKENSGLSDVGSKMDAILVENKKRSIFNRMKPALVGMFRKFYDIEIDILDDNTEVDIFDDNIGDKGLHIEPQIE